MIEKQIESNMFVKATEFLMKRYPKGWGGVAIIRTDNDNYYISVAIETANASAVLCIETGAICEAHKYQEIVTHCLCVARDDENSPFKILTPCGICQERLLFWGNSVKVAITTNNNELKFIELKELQKYHWTNAYSKENIEKMIDDN